MSKENILDSFDVKLGKDFIYRYFYNHHVASLAKIRQYQLITN